MENSDRESSMEDSNRKSPSNRDRTIIIAVGATAAGIVTLGFVLVAFLVWRQRTKKAQGEAELPTIEEGGSANVIPKGKRER